ncbi:MAG: MotA/TolQ/ExbB proton channel family protein [Oligoflexales bacterium]|nr:MotA/TolQ/ExbB proton channel family protein [Oligoflexales bacterium]
MFGFDSSSIISLLPSVVQRSLSAGPVVFSVLMLLLGLSVLTWAVIIAKWIYLRRMEKNSQIFLRSFWESRSLNELNTSLGHFAYSPVKEVFRNCYAELIKGSQLKDTAFALNLAIEAALDNLTRTLQKTRANERRSLERFLWLLANCASASPFIGLFGTVWGIMSAFEGIARSGSTSLATVAPGISEALIATAFGLGAAIPAVVAYNLAHVKIRALVSHIDSFGADFLNIVERYLVTDRNRQHQNYPPPADPFQTSRL